MTKDIDLEDLQENSNVSIQDFLEITDGETGEVLVRIGGNQKPSENSGLEH